MKTARTRMEGVLLIEPAVFPDERGLFMEAWSRDRYAREGLDVDFVQDNVSLSRRHVLRGLHFQNPVAQGKLVSVLRGAVWDVVVDLRLGSPTFAEWEGFTLREQGSQLYVPPGFAHGFVVTSDAALFSYKCTAPYSPPNERGLRWNDPDVGVAWPVDAPLLSEKDAAAPLLRDLPAGALFAGTEAGAVPA